MKFRLRSEFAPGGDQPTAIEKLTQGIKKYPMQTLLGVTGSGKTFTMANMIERVNMPTLVLSHNKTLAGQLYEEFKAFFPDNKVCYFISYYDYYQPESYLPSTDTYIEKDTQVNEKIEEFRAEAAASLMMRKDVIVVASVSCIYGLGSPKEYKKSAVTVKVGDKFSKKELLKILVRLLYERNEVELRSGRFQSKGDTIDIIQGFGQYVFRVELFGNEIESITKRDLITMQVVEKLLELTIFPATPFMVDESLKETAMKNIRDELAIRLLELPPLYAHRLKQRTEYDLEMIKELGFCKGIENYSRHFDVREPGTPPHCLLDFFPDDFLMFIDESHVTVSQVRGMYMGDFARKKNLIDYGFRLPSAADNRPLKFHEFERYMKHVVFVSATPAEYEAAHSGQTAEQIIRPTYLVDPSVEIHGSEGQIEYLLIAIRKVVKNGNRVLVTTLTKKMAEDLTDYLAKEHARVRYLHSEIDTLARAEIIRDLRLGKFDVLVGINLLREGLDLPEVELVAILDADKEGFLRNERSLIQIMGRASRNLNGHVILFADKRTESIKKALKESERRRTLQLLYNRKHRVAPQEIRKKVREGMTRISSKDLQAIAKQSKHAAVVGFLEGISGGKNKESVTAELELAMKKAAEDLDFESAIELRNIIKEFEES